MNEVQLLYVENVIYKKKTTLIQELTFFIKVHNLSPDKICEVVWTGEDDEWHTLSAHFHSPIDEDQEYWKASVTFQASDDQSLPGNIECVLRYKVLDEEYWDNNQGLNYFSQADSGVRLTHSQAIQNIGFDNKFYQGQCFLPVTIAVQQNIKVDAIVIHWTTDNWRTTQKTVCQYKRNHWSDNQGSYARNPNQYGVQIWGALLKIEDPFSLQYSLCCETKNVAYWDNNFDKNYSLTHDLLRILILNLHCYQEADQDYKFSQIAKAIDEQQVDVICLQEVAELWNNGHGDWDSNSAKIINDRLKTPYYLYTDWSHLGFDKFREGVAILSRFPLLKKASKYVSSDTNPESINSRKIAMAQVNVPYMGLVNLYSAHLSWWIDGFSEQFNNLNVWATTQHSGEVQATLLCGDFNVVPKSDGYDLVVKEGYEDVVNHVQSSLENSFKVTDHYWRDYPAEDHRIDYVFMKTQSALQTVSVRPIFTEHDYGRVSDHCGYLMTFEPK